MTTLTEHHTLLLTAALRRGAPSLDAWQEWCAGTSVDTLDHDAQWLLPLLFHNLGAQGVAAQRIVRYGNVYRHNWYKNHLALHKAASAINAWQAAGHRVILLGGAALAVQHYAALGARPFESISLLVRGVAADDRTDAVDVRSQLHSSDIDASLEVQTITQPWHTLRCLVLAPADQFVDLCIRRQRWERRSALLWIADVATLLAGHPDLDWVRVHALAEQAGACDAVAEALRAVAPWHPAPGQMTYPGTTTMVAQA